MSSRYFSYPTAWYVIRQKEQMEKAGQINFHKVAISEVKSRLGTFCTYLSHLKTKKLVEREIKKPNTDIINTINVNEDRIYFLAHIIKNGEKKKVRFDTGKQSAYDLVAEDYKALKEKIDEYVRS